MIFQQTYFISLKTHNFISTNFLFWKSGVIIIHAGCRRKRNKIHFYLVLLILEADRQPFSILAPEPQADSTDGYDVLQVIQVVQAQAHAKPKLMETSG